MMQSLVSPSHGTAAPSQGVQVGEQLDGAIPEGTIPSTPLQHWLWVPFPS